MCSKAPSLRGHYPASALLRTWPPPSRLSSLSRFRRLYDLPCSTDFPVGRGRFHQLLSMSLSPCSRQWHSVFCVRQLHSRQMGGKARVPWRVAASADRFCTECVRFHRGEVGNSVANRWHFRGIWFVSRAFQCSAEQQAQSAAHLVQINPRFAWDCKYFFNDPRKPRNSAPAISNCARR